MTLEVPTWRVEAAQPGQYGGRLRNTAHAVRSGHTLCGRQERAITWEDVPAHSAQRCSQCSAVPEGWGTSADVQALGLTYRQVDYLCREWLIPAAEPTPGSGTRRLFDPAAMSMVAAMAPMIRVGIPPRIAKKAVICQGKVGHGVVISVTGML